MPLINKKRLQHYEYITASYCSLTIWLYWCPLLGCSCLVTLVLSREPFLVSTYHGTLLCNLSSVVNHHCLLCAHAQYSYTCVARSSPFVPQLLTPYFLWTNPMVSIHSFLFLCFLCPVPSVLPLVPSSILLHCLSCLAPHLLFTSVYSSCALAFTRTHTRPAPPFHDSPLTLHTLLPRIS